MTRICIFLLCVAFFALIDARTKNAGLRDSKEINSEHIKLNEQTLKQKLINKEKINFDQVNKPIKSDSISKRQRYCNPAIHTNCKRPR
uniref:Secreted protein n=1 Tax=Hydra vulgaris TaxID=6087 RepID=B3VQ10_HYDVU|nr:secreted protein [Hydra vulgaris]